jgi:hypothetical protein
MAYLSIELYVRIVSYSRGSSLLQGTLFYLVDLVIIILYFCFDVMVRMIVSPAPPVSTPWVSKPPPFLPFGVERDHYRGHYQPRMMTDERFLPYVRMLCRDIQRRNTCMQLK